MSPAWLTRAGDRVYLEVYVQPGARHTGVAGTHDGCLKVRVAAPPVKGAANEALRRFLARAFGIPTSGVTLVRGAAGRRKRVAVTAPAVTPDWAARSE